VALIAPWSSDGEDQSILTLHPGRITELAGSTGLGLTRLGLRLLAVPSARWPVVALDVKGWLSPLAAWEVGVNSSRLVVVRCPDPGRWTQLAAALLEGARAMYAEVPASVGDHDLRRLAALARARRVGLALRPLGEGLPAGVAYLRLRATEIHWRGVENGVGRLQTRHVVVEASGKAMAGMTRTIEMVDDGADVVRLVSGMVTGEARRAAG
jgi:hypothetical protein